MDFGWWPLAAFFALTVGALENVLAFLAPELVPEVPAIGSFSIEGLRHWILLADRNVRGAR
jgi:hypothetical protein